MTVGVILEQLGTSVDDVPVVFDQAFRSCIRLADFALGPIGAEKPVIPQGSGVLLPRDPDALGCLLQEPFEATRAHGHVRAHLQVIHGVLRLLTVCRGPRQMPYHLPSRRVTCHATSDETSDRGNLW